MCLTSMSQRGHSNARSARRASLLLVGEMDAIPLVSLELSAASHWCGSASPNKLAEALSLLLPLLPLDCRARAACVCRAWRAATAHPSLWEELNFANCAVCVNDAKLALLCGRAGAALRTLYLCVRANMRVTGAGLVTALRDGGCTGVRRLTCVVGDRQHPKPLTPVLVQQLAAACPMLQHAECTVYCHPSKAAAVLTVLPGPLTLDCAFGETTGGNVDLTELMEHLRVNTTLTSLSLNENNIGEVGATQLADCLRVNTTLKSLNLNYNHVGNEGATQLADSLRVNSTLESLELHDNHIDVVGATQLAECLRVNATLTSLDLSANDIVAEGTAQLAECLRVNTTLTSLDLGFNDIGDAGALQLAEGLRTNTMLRRFSATGNYIGDAGQRALREACPPQCTLRLDWP